MCASTAESSAATGAVLDGAQQVRHLAQDFAIAGVAYDAWRFKAPVLEPTEHGIPIIAFPQTHARMGRHRRGCTPRSWRVA